MLRHRDTGVWLAPHATAKGEPVLLGGIDAVIARFARRQAGIVARWQLLTAGVGVDAIDRRVASGALQVIHQGVYAVGQRALAATARLWADLLRCGPDARLGGLDAAALHSAATGPPGARTTVVVPPGAQPAPRGVRTRRLVLLPGERAVVDGLPCLAPGRTLLDVSAIHGSAAAERVWRGLVHHGRLDMDEVAALLERHDGERGIVAVRDLFERRLSLIGASESGLEERVARLAVLAGLPEPRRNERVVLSSGRVVRFDLCVPDLWLAIEADGPYHDDPEVQADDAARDAAAAADGWRTERVRHDETDHAAVRRLRRLTAA